METEVAELSRSDELGHYMFADPHWFQQIMDNLIWTNNVMGRDASSGLASRKNRAVRHPQNEQIKAAAIDEDDCQHGQICCIAWPKTPENRLAGG